MKRSARNDLFLGTVYGVGLSLAMWTLALDAPGLGPGVLGVGLGALLLGVVPRRIPRLGRLDSAYAASIAGALVAGPGLSVLALALTRGCRRLVRGPSAGRHPIAPWSLRLAASVAAVAVAAATAELFAGTTRGPSFLAIHLTVFIAIERGISIGARVWCARRSTIRLTAAPLGSAATGLVALTLGCSVAALAVHATAGGFAWIATGVAIAGIGVASRRVARLRRASFRRRFAARRHAALALACAGAARGAGVERARRLERMARAIALRMELDESLADALGCAALLHHARSSRDARRRPFAIDEAVFPHPVSTILRTVDERWDGMGPHGVRSRSIHVGARILAAVSAWLAWRERDDGDGDEAIGRVLDESGRRFDPLVVDALIDHVDAEAETVSVEAPRLELLRAPADAAPVEPVARTLDWAGRELDAFYEIAKAARAGLDVDATLTLVAARLTTLVPHATMVVYRLDGDQRLRPVFAAGVSSAALRRVSVPLGERLSGRCALDRSARIGETGEVDGHDLAGYGLGPERERLAAALAAPMVVGERTVGVLSVYDRRQRRFGAEDRRRISRVAACIAEIVEHERAARETTTANSMTDPLTGLPSAAFLDGAIRERIERRTPFGLLGIRIRGVERIAARHGAHIADRMLAGAAGRLGRARRVHDTAVRLGDDLFVLLTDSHGADELLAHASRVTRELRDVAGDATLPGRVRPVVAHACCPDDGETIDTLLETLDGRLADAIERGRGVIPFREAAATGSRGSAIVG